MTAQEQPHPTLVKTTTGHVYQYRGEGHGVFQRLAWNTGRLISRVISIFYFRLRATGQQHVPVTGGALMVTNHQSFLDPWLIGIAPSRQIHSMARDTLFKGGILTFLMELWNAFPVKRGAADLAAIRTAADRLDQGFVVNVFPEGTRSLDGSIGPIAPGISLILNRAKVRVPIVPVIIEGAFEAWPRQARFPRGYPIHIHYGRPIPPSEWRTLSPADLAARIRTELAALQRTIGSPHALASATRMGREKAQPVRPSATRSRQK